jgi:cold-inducible RNA-binding protein
MMRIFVGNLSYQTSQQELEELFWAFGTVQRVNVITDRDSGQSRGFAFVEMSDRNEGNNAIAALNGAEVSGRRLIVSEARPRDEQVGRPSRGFAYNRR